MNLGCFTKMICHVKSCYFIHRFIFIALLILCRFNDCNMHLYIKLEFFIFEKYGITYVQMYSSNNLN